MDFSTVKIICYTGGTCGDLITGLIDSKNTQLFETRIKHDVARMRLKKPHEFKSVEGKKSYLVDIATQYKSIPSHDLDYHSQQGHAFISITVKDKKCALWAADRFKNMHRPPVWEEMSRFSGAKTVEDYAQLLLDYSNLVETKTPIIIKLESIVAGDALDDLKQLVDTPLDNDLYANWLKAQH
jgi:hypothetical protein